VGKVGGVESRGKGVTGEVMAMVQHREGGDWEGTGRVWGWMAWAGALGERVSGQPSEILCRGGAGAKG